jgi:predicted kinase
MSVGARGDLPEPNYEQAADMTIKGSTLRPQLIIVSGRPGAGKTTLSRALSQTLRCPLVSRDEIHNGIHRTLSISPAPVTAERLRDLAFYGFFQAVEFFLSRDVTLVIEAAFRDQIWRRELNPALSMADAKVIQCELGVELARERVIQRRLAERNCGKSAPDQSKPLAETGRITVQDFEPLSLPVPTIRVNTSDSYDPSFDEIVAFANSRMVDPD